MDLQLIWDLIVIGCGRGGLYALMAVGLSLVFGVMNVPQFSHGEFYMLGAYAAYFVFRVSGFPPLIAIAAAGIAGFVAGIVVEKAVFEPLRRRANGQWVMNAFLVTVGLSVAMQNGARALWGGSYFGITRYWQTSMTLGTSMAIPLDRVMGFVIAMLTISAFWAFLRWTNTGRAIRAVAQDETGAMLVGIDPDRIRTLTFGLSTMLAAIAGGCLLSLVPAHPAVGLEPLYKSWFVVILGGLGNLGAAIPAGFLVGMFETLSYYAFGAGWQNVVSISLIILVLLFKPSGVFGGKVRGIWEK
ncbi:MAG: branched-chain amino acid ABC transporter permease [Bryobacteraceae bacterium]